MSDLLQKRNNMMFDSDCSDSEGESFRSTSEDFDPNTPAGRLKINHKEFPFHRSIMEEVLVRSELKRL